jgi:dethiobiotin synthetase
MPSRYFITGTDTGVGKTVTSALLCAALNALYWKPIQTGSCQGTDRATVIELAGLSRLQTLPEAYIFRPPVSPHLAARLAGKRIDLGRIRPPKLGPGDSLIVEGAGGVLVPVNETQLMTALIKRMRFPVLLVSRTTLGTINHTLLSIAALRAARLEVRGVIMVGKANLENRKAIEHYGHVRVAGLIPPLRSLDRESLLSAFRKYFDRKLILA